MTTETAFVFMIVAIIYAIITLYATVKIIVDLKKDYKNIVRWYYVLLTFIIVVLILPAASFYTRGGKIE
jgi:predicted tellurium resistance membrane protein TerC